MTQVMIQISRCVSNGYFERLRDSVDKSRAETLFRFWKKTRLQIAIAEVIFLHKYESSVLKGCAIHSLSITYWDFVYVLGENKRNIYFLTES